MKEKKNDMILSMETYSNLIKLPKLQRPISVDGGSDILAVVAALHRLKVSNAAHVGQPGLNLGHVQHLSACTSEKPLKK